MYETSTLIICIRSMRKSRHREIKYPGEVEVTGLVISASLLCLPHSWNLGRGRGLLMKEQVGRDRLGEAGNRASKQRTCDKKKKKKIIQEVGWEIAAREGKVGKSGEPLFNISMREGRKVDLGLGRGLAGEKGHNSGITISSPEDTPLHWRKVS